MKKNLFRCSRFVENFYNGCKDLTLCPYRGFACKGDDPCMPCFIFPDVEPTLPFDFVEHFDND